MNTISTSIGSRTIQQPGTAGEAAARRKANHEAITKMLRDTVQEANNQAHEEYLSQKTNPASTQVQLTDQQKKYLSETYQPQNMSQKDFSAFVEDLYQFGILTDRDKSILGCGGKKDNLLAFRTTCSVVPYEPGKMLDTFDDCSGDVLAWTKYQASIENFDPQAGKFYHGSTSILFARLHNVLQQISFQGSVQSTRAVRDKAEMHQAAGKLSAEEMAGLSSKYNPSHMTQQQYHAFLDELEEKGVLSKTEKLLVKCPEMRFGDHLEPHGVSLGGGYVIEDPLMPLTSQDYDGNASLFVKALLERECALAERISPHKEDLKRIAALRKVSNILDSMRI